MSSPKKIILVIGATGAQGIAVIDALLKRSADGSPSPTLDPQSRRAAELASRGVEIVKGNTENHDSVATALQGVYGAFINTDSFGIGGKIETFSGIRIFELAKEAKTKTNYNPLYASMHYTGKARVSDRMRSQESVVSDDSLSWNILNTVPYMDMLKTGVFGPVRVLPDGTHVFPAPLGKGRVPMIALSDLGFFARYIFDNREATSAQELEVTSDMVGWDDLVATFTRVTGKKAEYKALSFEEWFALFNQEDIARTVAPDTTVSWKETFTRFWASYRDGIITRDLDWIRRVHPGTLDLESWMRAEGYTGKIGHDLLKNAEDGKGMRPNLERIGQL